MAFRGKVHMNEFFRKNKQVIKPFLKKYIEENDRTFFNIWAYDDELCDILGEKWSAIARNFRCWIIAEALLDLDKRLEWWTGKQHKVLYRPSPQLATA